MNYSVKIICLIMKSKLIETIMQYELLPLMLCPSDMISPRLNALSLWLLFQSPIIIPHAVLIDVIAILYLF